MEQLIVAYRLQVIIVGLFLVIGGIVGWRQSGISDQNFEAATGAESISTEATITQKKHEVHRGSKTSDNHIYILSLEYTYKGAIQRGRVGVNPDEYDSVQEGGKTKISFHPNNLDFLITPKMYDYTLRVTNVKYIFMGMISLGLVLLGLVARSFLK